MTEQQAAQQTKAVLVVGGGIGGLTVAVETAEAGWPVVVVEKNAFVGGRVAANHLYFPKMCPPTCGLEINFQRLRKNPAIRILTLAEVTKVSGGAKDAVATVTVKPRFVNEKCTACGKCVEVCPVSRPDAFNAGWARPRPSICPTRWPTRSASSSTPRSASGNPAASARRPAPTARSTWT